MSDMNFVVLDDENALCKEFLAAINGVMKVENTSLRNALLEEIVGLMRKANKPIRYMAAGKQGGLP